MSKRSTYRRYGIIARRALAALGLVVVMGAMPAAAELEDADRKTSKLRFEAMPYAWVPGFHGSIDVKDTTLRVDVDPGDVLQLVFDGNAFAAGGYFALFYDRLSVFADSFGGYAEVSVAQTIPTQLCCTLTIDARTKMKFALTDVGVGYDVLRLTLPERERPLTLAAWAGARVMYLSNEVDAKFGVLHGAERAANVVESVDWADPLIGVRWSVPVHDAIDLDFRGDIGGFGASSDLTWGLLGNLRVWLPWKPFDLTLYAVAGYRVVAFDRSPDDAEVDLQMRGPMLGAGFVF